MRIPHPPLASLLAAFLLAMAPSPFAASPSPPPPPYPESPFVVDVTRPPYSARGDGTTDDTAALQAALDENVGRHRVLYFPKGTYLVSTTLSWPKRWKDHENWGKTMLRGQDRDTTVLRLRDRTFTRAAEPGAIMNCGGFGSADWFHNYVEDFTFDVGSGNPGAIALRFYSNNSGAVRRCRFLAPTGSGAIGLDLAHRDMNGPLLVQDCEVTGFEVGIATGHAVNSQTFERLRIHGQTRLGFDNTGQAVAIRQLVSDNAVPALRSYGTVCLLESTLRGRKSAAEAPAIINYNGGRMLLRDVASPGYGRSLAEVPSPDFAAAFRIRGEDRPGTLGPVIEEYSTDPPGSLFPAPPRSLRLPVKDPPAPLEEPASSWANVDTFGADPAGVSDSAAAIQRAIDSGAGTIFLPGSYRLRSTVVLRGKVQRLVGLGGMINYGVGLRPDFRLADGEGSAVVIEHLSHVDGGLEVDTRRTLVMRSVSDCDLTFTARAEGGELHLEDVVTHGLKLRRQRLWARQLDIENEGLHLLNDAGDAWILGYKTERGGTLVETRGGGRTEVLGTFGYTTTAGKLAPMFEIADSGVFAYFTEVCFNGDPFVTLVRERRGSETRLLRRGEGRTTPFVAVP